MLAGPLLLAGLGLVAGAAPSAMGTAIVGPAVTAVLGRPAEVSLKLWHGFNLVLALSAATMALGVAVYLPGSGSSRVSGGSASSTASRHRAL